MTGVRRVVPLTYGWAELPETVSIHGGDPAVRYREPVPGVLLELDGGWLLIDTGFNVPLARDPFLSRRFHGHKDIHCELLPDDRDSLEVAFETAGVDPAEVAVVALSHLHNDHSGGLRWFVERCPVHLQSRELAYGLSSGTVDDHPDRHGFCRVDYDDRRIDWRLVDGDTEIAPGVTAVWTPGHTPGHQSFVVTLDDRAAADHAVPGFVLAFDAADLQRNIDDELAPGSMVGASVEQAVDSIRRLKSIAGERHYQLVPGHDPHAWPAFTLQLGVAGP